MNNVQYESKKKVRNFFMILIFLNHIILMNNVHYQSKKNLQLIYDI
jgi:hypothetical protein